jgi:hypothetical protein
MPSIAIFVDAGYLLAQGGVAVHGDKLSRTRLLLDCEAARTALVETAREVAPDARLLRIYWYDGIFPTKGLTTEHTSLANLSDVKLRLGFINSAGQQKGVDSLIVTDMIELARNRAIDEALLLSGDEDVRVGVVIAQSFGVRLHLLGVAPARGSQSPALIQESDTHREWGAARVSAFLRVSAAPEPPRFGIDTMSSTAVPAAIPAFELECAATIDSILSQKTPDEIRQLQDVMATQQGVPADIDGKLIARLGGRIGGVMLDNAQKKAARRMLRDRLTQS